ncbi:14743_t:CDS:2, partial [Entrophospora sp. SA101]
SKPLVFETFTACKGTSTKGIQFDDFSVTLTPSLDLQVDVNLQASGKILKSIPDGSTFGAIFQSLTTGLKHKLTYPVRSLCTLFSKKNKCQTEAGDIKFNVKQTIPDIGFFDSVAPKPFMKFEVQGSDGILFCINSEPK